MALCYVLWWVLSDEQAHSSDLEYGSINIILCTCVLHAKSPEQKFRFDFPNSYSAYSWCCYV